jgi:hypothetical protein
MKQTVKEMKITQADFDSDLLESLPKPTPQRPKGFGITVREYAIQRDCSIRMARDILDRLVKEGELQKQEMRLSAKSEGYVYHKEKK